MNYRVRCLFEDLILRLSHLFFLGLRVVRISDYASRALLISVISSSLQSSYFVFKALFCNISKRSSLRVDSFNQILQRVLFLIGRRECLKRERKLIIHIDDS